MPDRRRKKIPDKVKLIAALKRMGLTIEQVQFDHNPALALRPIDPVTGDTIPSANDPNYIDLLLITEHKVKTFGKGGEKRVTTAGSDVGNIAKVRRLEKAQEEARRRMLATDTGEEPVRKSRWPKRSFQTRKYAKRGNPNES